MIFKRESKRMLKKQIAKLEKLGWTLEEDNEYYISFNKKSTNWNDDALIDSLAISRVLDKDSGIEKPALIFKCSAYDDGYNLQDAHVMASSMTAPEAWAAIGIAVAKGWRAMK